MPRHLIEPVAPRRITDFDFTGRVLHNGRYHCINKLKSGTYGVIYRATDYEPDGSGDSLQTEEVAIKVYSKTRLDTLELKRIRQARVLHRTMSDHPNVVTLRDDFEDQHHIYLVFDLCPGGTLHSHIKKNALFWKDDDLIRKVFLQILDAVEACHARGVSHRALNPQNILCNEDGTQVFLTGFDMATDKKTASDFNSTSQAYTSPGDYYPQQHHAEATVC